jgi:hypothetical protein
MKRYIDAQLALFVLLALGASVLSSHGAFQFFLYLVDEWLAWVFILVVALGIIGLDAAGTISRGAARWAYYTGMAFFLLLETLANYFAGQAGFVAKIVAKLPVSSDLRTIAEGHPAATRALVVIFLSMASLAVAYFTFAATMRFQQIRIGMERPIIGRLRRLLEQRRTLTRRLVSRLRQERQTAEYNLNTLRAAAEQQARHAEQLVSSLRAELNRRPAQMEVEVIEVARYRLTYEQLAQLAGASVSTVRRKLPELVSVNEQGE